MHSNHQRYGSVKASRMPKKLYTATDIEALVKQQKATCLQLEKGDLITPMARDVARELSLNVYEPGESPSTPVSSSNGTGSDSLEAKVRLIVSAMLDQPKTSPHAATFPVTLIDSRSTSMPPFAFEINRPEMDVRCEDVITQAHGSPMAAGFLTMHAGSFPWTLNYDEVEYVIEGELHIGTAQGTVIGKPGDVIFIPKGTSITFGTPSWAKFLYVTYPVDWAG
jgi:ethanolamine utilization protein EutQ